MRKLILAGIVLLLITIAKWPLLADNDKNDSRSETPFESTEGKETVKVAAAQILTDYNIGNNLQKITRSIRKADSCGCEIILFHEGCLTGYPDKEHIGQIDFGEVREGEQTIRDLAKELRIAVLLGSSGKSRDGYSNYVLVINEEGKVLGRYLKAWRAGEPFYEAGSGPVIFQVAGVESTVIICHDLRYPALARLGVAAGARIVFIANNESGITAEHKLLGYRSMQIARATENRVYSVMSNSPADPDDIRRHNCSHGNSKIVNPSGVVLDEARVFEQRLVTATLDLTRATRSTVLRTMGKNQSIKELYDTDYENPEYSKWILNGLKLVRRLDGSDVPDYLKTGGEQ